MAYSARDGIHGGTRAWHDLIGVVVLVSVVLLTMAALGLYVVG